MTRREEIVKAAHEFYKGDEVSTFVVAAQWADKTMIEKACAWLEQYQESYEMHDAWNGDYVSFKSFIIDFRKAMEE